MGTNTVSILGLTIHDGTLIEAADHLITAAKENKRQITFFVNAHCVNLAAEDKHYLSVLESADLLYADGSGMALAARLADIQLRDNINGTDLFPLLCEQSAQRNVPCALLGARPGIAQRCAEQMQERYSGLSIPWTNDGYFNENEEDQIIDAINASGAQILFVAFGVPKQELWIAENADKLNIPIILGVGALFDFYSGTVQRAPKFMRKLGLEWVFRFILEPRRMFHRYITGNPKFIARAVSRRLRGKDVLTSKKLS